MSKRLHKRLALFGMLACLGASSSLISGCTGNGGGYVSPSVHVGVGYRGYYGSPWYARDAYDAGVVDTIDAIETMDAIDYGGGAPMGGYGGGMDMGGFDW